MTGCTYLGSLFRPVLRIICLCCVVHVQEIKITGATIFTNPYQELEDEEKDKQQAAAKQVRHPGRGPAIGLMLYESCLAVANVYRTPGQACQPLITQMHVECF